MADLEPIEDALVEELRDIIWSHRVDSDTGGRCARAIVPIIQAREAAARADEREKVLEEARKQLNSIQPDEEAAGCPASWGDFLQIADSVFRALKAALASYREKN